MRETESTYVETTGGSRGGGTVGRGAAGAAGGGGGGGGNKTESKPAPGGAVAEEDAPLNLAGSAFGLLNRLAGGGLAGDAPPAEKPRVAPAPAPAPPAASAVPESADAALEDLAQLFPTPAKAPAAGGSGAPAPPPPESDELEDLERYLDTLQKG